MPLLSVSPSPRHERDASGNTADGDSTVGVSNGVASYIDRGMSWSAAHWKAITITATTIATAVILYKYGLHGKAWEKTKKGTKWAWEMAKLPFEKVRKLFAKKADSGSDKSGSDSDKQKKDLNNETPQTQDTNQIQPPQHQTIFERSESAPPSSSAFQPMSSFRITPNEEEEYSAHITVLVPNKDVLKDQPMTEGTLQPTMRSETRHIKKKMKRKTKNPDDIPPPDLNSSSPPKKFGSRWDRKKLGGRWWKVTQYIFTQKEQEEWKEYKKLYTQEFGIEPYGVGRVSLFMVLGQRPRGRRWRLKYQHLKTLNGVISRSV